MTCEYETIPDVFLMDAARPVNVMLDLETWGTRPGSALRSIGACLFDPYTHEIDADKFYYNIDADSCREAGLDFDPGTVKWWATQKQEAQDALLVDPQPVHDVMNMFHEWFKRRGVYVWSQGANFDEPLWTEACRLMHAKKPLKVYGTFGNPWPWKFWDTRCTRTAYDVCGFNPKTVTRMGTHHNALDDAIYQARCVQAAYKLVSRD